MFYLILTVISSSLISILMRYFEPKVKNNMAMFVFNYIVCAILSYLYMPKTIIHEGHSFALVLGIISGILYLVCFVVFQKNIKLNGIVLSGTFNKLGVVIPTLMAILIFKEKPKYYQLIAILLVILAIIVINIDHSTNKAKYTYLLIVLLVLNGLTDSTTNIYDKLGNSLLKDNYLLYTFIFAGICAFVIWLKRKQSIKGIDILAGILIGIPNYFSSRFMLLALSKLPAIICYPFYSVGTIFVITLTGIFIFKEKINKNKLVALFMIVGALILLNI